MKKFLLSGILLLGACASQPLAVDWSEVQVAPPSVAAVVTDSAVERELVLYCGLHAADPESIPQGVVFFLDDEVQPASEAEEPPAAAGGNSDLAAKAQNPIANLISLPFQNNTNFDIGPHDRNQNVLNIQPVIPVDLSDDLLLINRTIVPVIYQPDITSSSKGEWGLGDINYTGFLSPKNDSEWTWGIGPSLTIPTATDDVLGSDKWSAGPSLVVLTTPGKWVVGAIINNLWSFAGSSSADSVNQMLLQYFVNYNLEDGWYLTSAPIILADWTVDQADRWIIPFGAGVGKVFKIGKQPINASLQGYYNVRHPSGGPRWQLRVQVQFLFPK